MDLDKKELEATRKMREKTADEMFEELGYAKKEDWWGTYCDEKTGETIEFKEDKTFSKYYSISDIVIDISMEELKAIHKFYEEQGWI